MNARKIVSVTAVATLLAMLTILILAPRVTGEAMDSIIVNEADEVREASTNIDQGLHELLADVDMRVVLQYANQLRHIDLSTVPDPLATLLGQVPARVVVEYGNGIRHKDLSALPEALKACLGQVSERILIQHANANRQEPLRYPLELLDDTTPPQISDIEATPKGEDSVGITWTTDEFATSLISYGTQPNVYTETVSDGLYFRQHEITLTNLRTETAYYYIVQSTDQSGNTATSSEHTFSTTYSVYLPLVIREG